MIRLNRRIGIAVLGGLAAASFASAQQPPVLKGSQVTENALIDALTIEGPQAADGKTRGFSPVMRPSGSQAAQAAGPGKANLMITFQTDSAELTPESIKTLETVAHALQSDKLAGFSFRIEGHADPRGSADHNQVLSEARAKAVVDYLVNKQGILPERLVAIGKGSADLYDPQHPDSAENRRVSIVTTR